MTRSFSSFGIMCLHCLFLIVVGKNNSYDNVAFLKPSEQSTTIENWEAHKAVDNNSRSCSSTNGSANDWWEVDLGQHHHIQDITIITHESKPGVHSTSISVDGLMCSNIIENALLTVHVRCNHTVYGRKVRATKEHNATEKFLVICEFIVSGCNGKYKNGCFYQCGQCSDNENCNYENGRCRNCVPGKKYPMCTNDCDDGSYGHNCSEKCGHCNDRNKCNKSNGYCSSCQEGFGMPLCKQAEERTSEATLATAKERETAKVTTDVNARGYDTKVNLALIAGVASVIVAVIIIIVIIIIIMIRKRKRPCEKMLSSDAIDSGVSSSKPDSGLKPQVGGDSVETFHMVDCAIYEGTDVEMG